MLIPDGRINFGEWLPDLPFYENEGLVEAKNVIPVDRAYKDYLALATADDALVDKPLGAFACLDSSNDSFIYAGIDSDLYVKNGSAWTDLSTATYNTAADGYWRFTQFDNLVIATNYADTAQAATVGASTFGALGTTGTAPRGRQVAVINRFVMLGDTDGVGGTVPNRVQWCAIDNPRDWPTPNTADARSKQSGAQALPVEYGPVTAISGGQFFGLVFQAKAINRFTYVGGDVVFQVVDYEQSRGCWFPQSLVKFGQLRFFIAADGFYLTDGQAVKGIGNEKVDRFFLFDCDQSYKHRVMGAVDYVNKCIFWCYPNQSATDGRPNQLMIYQLPSKLYPEGRWAHAEDTMHLIFSSIADGYTLDQLDSLYTSIDDMTVSLDSSNWQGGANTLMAFGSDYKLGTFSGDAATARFESGEYEMNAGGYQFIRGIRPFVTGNPTNITAAIGVRSNQDNEGRTFGTAVQRTTRTGVCDFRQNARFASVRIDIEGGFDRAIGFSFDGVPGGQV